MIQLGGHETSRSTLLTISPGLHHTCETVNLIDHSEKTMPVLTTPESPTHRLEGTTFTSLATPSRGSSDLAVWSVEMAPRTPGTPHSRLDPPKRCSSCWKAKPRCAWAARQATAHPGDAIVVPAGIPFEVANDDDSVLRLLCFMQAGGQDLVG